MNSSLDKLYQLRTNFMVIGLTGRLGSGCTTIAKFLTQETFSSCNFPTPETRDFKGNEERKYRIVYNFMQSNWHAFIPIRASDIITAILLENSLEDVKIFLKIIYDIDDKKIEQIFNEKIDDTTTTISDEYKALNQQRLEIKNIDERKDKSLKKDKAYEFYIEKNRLNRFTEILKLSFIKNLKTEHKASPFQYFGDNIRISGNALKDSEDERSDSYKIPKIIDKLIESIREKKKGERVWIVIDSIRNSLEAFYFKERFSSFYLFAINTENKYRFNRLSHTYNEKELLRLDQEYDAEVKSKEKFYKQDIKSCIQSSDIYLYNPDNEGGDSFKTLKKDLIRYLALIFQPGIITPTPMERCMQIAYTAKYNSGCISRQVGAVVADTYFSIKSIGWNNTAEGQTPCLLRSVDDLLTNSDSEAFSEYESRGEIKKLLNKTFSQKEEFKADRSTRLQGRNLPFCFKDGQNCIDGEKNQVHTRSLHAEENAMLQISKYGGEGLKGGFLFTTASPCELCSKKAYQLGIKRIYYIDPYPGISQKQIINSGHESHKPGLFLFSGAIGRAYHLIFEPFLPYKDELKIRLDFKYSRSDDEPEHTISIEDKIAELEKQKMIIEGTIINLKKESNNTTS